MKLKHNKKRNTAFLFEALILEMTKASVDKNIPYRNAIKSVIVEFFNKNSILYQELQVYKAILESKDLKDEKFAERILFESKKEYSTLSKQKIFSAQSALINRINKALTPSIFNNPVRNYKEMASIYQVFNSTPGIRSRVVLEEEIVHFMCESAHREEKPVVDKLTLKIAVDKYNQKYSDLLENQKTLLNKYVMSGRKDNFADLVVFLSEEIYRLEKNITNSLQTEEAKKNKVIKENTLMVLNLIKEFKNQEVDDNLIKTVLKLQKLESEILS